MKEYKCEECGKQYFIIEKSKGKHQFCSKTCQHSFYKKENKKEGQCLFCKQTFLKRNNTHKYCSYKCKYLHSRQERKERTYTCSYCKKEFTTLNKKRGKNTFCSKECNLLFVKKKSEKLYFCDFCKKEFIAKYKQQKFCSVKCQNEWQSKIKKRPKVPNKTTTIQIIVDEILRENKISFENEKRVGYYHIDNFLIEEKLCIEVMGEYWHCDSRTYKTISPMQKSSILRDKQKNSFLKNNYGYNTLYLWEKEIRENKLLCEKLIKKFIKNKGKLKNYHSFNYVLTSNKKLRLKEEKIIPFMDCEIKYLNQCERLNEKTP